MANKERPEKELVLEESGKTLKMTYLMMNDILRYVGSPDEAMSLLLTSQDTRDLVIRRLLTDTDKPIEDLKDLMPVSEVNEIVDIFEIDDIIAWTMEHVTYFFMRTADKLSKAALKFPELQVKIPTTPSSDPSKTGSEVSQTPTKSAGPTESSQASTDD